MSVAIPTPPQRIESANPTAPTAELVLVPGDGQAVQRSSARSVRVGRRGMVIELAGQLADSQHVWVEVDLPNGESVRPLAQVTAVAEGWAALRFVHLFPDHQRTLDAWHTEQSTGSGY